MCKFQIWESEFSVPKLFTTTAQSAQGAGGKVPAEQRRMGIVQVVGWRKKEDGDGQSRVKRESCGEIGEV